MKVWNLNGMNQPERQDRTWLAQWELKSGQNAFLCAVKDCIRRPTVGGLVQREMQDDGEWYIVPLCTSCNAHTRQELEIWDMAHLVAVLDTKIEQRALPRRTVAARRLIPAVS